MAAFESNWVMSTSPNAASSAASSSADGGEGSSSSQQQQQPTYASFTPAPGALPKHTSPLLSSTPPTVTKALSSAYPFILAADHVLGLLTWTSNDMWKSCLLVIVWTAVVGYFEILVRYFGHLLAVGGIAGYVFFHQRVEQEQEEQPTLDAIVHTLNNVVLRLDLFLTPLTSLYLTRHDVSRLLFTTLFLTPIYMIMAFFLFTPRSILLLSGVFVLTYHSVWARVTRAVLWRSRTVRLVTFYLTGLDFSGTPRGKSFSDSQSARTTHALGVQSKDGKPVRFTYVLYENQRRWLGIGWTANLLAYERTPWTDEFLNEASSPENFSLPSAEGTAMTWRWVDKTWRLDLTNDGSLTVNSKTKTTPDPSPNDGFIYYDNTWKKPSSEDSFSKYTRRRRWVRTAELVPDDAPEQEDDTEEPQPSTSSEQQQQPRKRKSLRFANEDEQNNE